ncbi:MAG TPA: 30S ribosomal protein S8e [Candidatus Pacearchaeota archaeon]|nr:30S ribosomal protein S8e [Candidatus Pacearchaeota archaeon]
MATKKGRKISGGRYRTERKKKKSELPGKPRMVRLGKEKKKLLRRRGGRLDVVLLSTDKANVVDPKTKKARVVKIKNVLEVPSNQFLARRNILCKGAIIETEIGKARITNRPSQEGCVNAVLIS